jgi:DNA-3-methyladenine glycosylase
LSTSTLQEALAGSPTDAAPRLLGRILVSEVDGRVASVLITEVEAYGGGDDPASHAARGPTGRNRSMFGAPGTLYVYRSYGIHWCLNVVCRPAGEAAAVLIRGGDPIEGLDTMAERRGRADHLTDGPGKLAQALAVSGEHDGTSVFEGQVRIEGDPVPGVIEATRRVGIRRARGRLWRFVLRVS